MKSKALRLTALALIATCGLVSLAEARIGRPLTPMSYAGVARRTAVRAPVYGAAALAVGTAAVVGTAAAVDNAAANNNCWTTYNAYGQQVTTCN